MRFIGRKIGAPRHQRPAGEVALDGIAAQEPGNAEEGRNRIAIPQRGSDRCDSAFHLRISPLQRHAVERERVGVAVRADRMSGSMNLAHRVGIGLGHLPDQEEGRLGVRHG